MTSEAGSVAGRLNELLLQSGSPELDASVASRFESYLRLLLRWNARTNLTAVRNEEGILRLHFLESIACARAIKTGVRTLLDFGSGAGFPGIPIALCRPEIAVTLAESQNKKASFLREVVRILEISTRVHSGRAETLEEKFECVTLRAVDQMARAARAGADLVQSRGWLCVLTTRGGEGGIRSACGPDFAWNDPIELASGSERVLIAGARRS